MYMDYYARHIQGYLIKWLSHLGVRTEGLGY